MLPDYSAPCKGNPADVLINGLACWRDPTHTIDHAPLVALNFTGKTVFPLPGLGLPAHSVVVHPAPDRFAIVAWKSPLNAIVSITGSFTDLNSSCGNGVLWFIDRNSHRLASGDLANGGAESFSLPSVVVSEGQVLYFIVDPKNGDYGCDSTMLDLNIAEAE